MLALAVAAGCRATAVHVDHGLRRGSAAEAEQVAAAAARLGAGFQAAQVRVEPGPNLESRARAARRAALGEGAATGHTMDDQAETVLINLLRGAAADGLAAMAAGPAHPVLALRRAETHALCAELGLAVLRDPMNDDRRFLRTRVRHELLPLCSAIAGRDIVPVLARQAEVLRAEVEVLEALAGALDACDGRSLAGAPEAVARRAVRRWLRGDGAHPPDLAGVERVLAVARGERRATEVAPATRVRRTAGRLRAEPVGAGAGPPADTVAMGRRSGTVGGR